MGNCQAVDAAALVIQHPNGKQERMYWSIKASEVMKLNPGHYVSLIIPLFPTPNDRQHNPDDKRTVQFTRVKLLRPSDTLVLGRAYRLVTTQEVIKVLRAKKQSKMKRNQSELGGILQMNQEKQSIVSSDTEKNNDQASDLERHRNRSGSTNLAAGTPKSWRPSLQSISESDNGP